MLNINGFLAKSASEDGHSIESIFNTIELGKDNRISFVLVLLASVSSKTDDFYEVHTFLKKYENESGQFRHVRCEIIPAREGEKGISSETLQSDISQIQGTYIYRFDNFEIVGPGNYSFLVFVKKLDKEQHTKGDPKTLRSESDLKTIFLEKDLIQCGIPFFVKEKTN
jgi:hypothetical protein